MRSQGFEFPPDLMDRVRHAARAEGKPLADMIIVLIERGLEAKRPRFERLRREAAEERARGGQKLTTEPRGELTLDRPGKLSTPRPGKLWVPGKPKK
jgi:CopG-like RHH_1 or ribbon-helix-helix domain, RHH_5